MGWRSICAAIKGEISRELGISVSMGIAPNRLVAKMASEWDKPDGLVIVRPEELPERIHALPVTALPGVGATTEKRLAQMGVESIGQLARVPKTLLDSHFGKHGDYLYRAARAEDDTPVPYYRPGQDARKQISREETLAHDTRDLAVLERRLLALCESVGRRLRARGESARTITVKVKLSSFKLFTRSVSVKAATDLDEEIFEHARTLLGRVQFGAQRARLIGVGVSNLVEGSGPGQLNLFDARAGRLSQLSRARDALAERYGRTTVTRASLVHEPEAPAQQEDEEDDPLARL